jgi:ribosome-binding protein aMBF1 (putative translation factor)
MEEPMSNTPADEVTDMLVLAAVDRAERHGDRATRAVPIWEVLGHLGVAVRTRRARHVRVSLEALEASGSLELSRRHGVPVWVLTRSGRRRLSRARRAGRVPVLPESPQHRKWREARRLAEQRIEEFRAELGDAVEHTQELLDAPVLAAPVDGDVDLALGVTSDVWFEVGDRLHRGCRRLGSASYCLWEWREPDDARPDTDDLSDPCDRAFDARRRALRRARRSGRRNTRLWDSRPELVLLGQAIREVREEQEMSAGALAGKAGIAERRMARLEAGKLDPDYDLMLRLADALSVESSTFVLRAEALDTKDEPQ